MHNFSARPRNHCFTLMLFALEIIRYAAYISSISSCFIALSVRCKSHNAKCLPFVVSKFGTSAINITDTGAELLA